MSWHVEFAPEVEPDVAEAADWYEARQAGLGAKFIEEIIHVWEALADNPLLNSKNQKSSHRAATEFLERL